MDFQALSTPFRASEGPECPLGYRSPLKIGMGFSKLKTAALHLVKKLLTHIALDAAFYKMSGFDLCDQLSSTPTADFLSLPRSSVMLKDPLCTGTSLASSSAGREVLSKAGARPLGQDADDQSKRPNRRAKLKASQAMRKDGAAAAVALRILETCEAARSPSISTTDLPHATTGFVGRSDRADCKAFASGSHGLPTLIDNITQAECMRLLDPQCSQRALVDVHDRVFAVKVKQPSEGWAAIYTRAENAFAVIAAYYALEPHRRGHFKTHTFGVAMGNGSTAPHLLHQSDDDIKLHARFVSEVESYVAHFTGPYGAAPLPIVSVTNLNSASAKLWMPDLMQQYSELQLELLGINSMLTAVFPGSPFNACTINMGPQTVCLPHRDYWNLAYGTCPIGVLGPFNHRTGGQMILHEPKVIIELRRGDVMFIPSAAVTHENAPIAIDEQRYSFTLYTAGGLFRYVWCGGLTVKELTARDTEKHKVYTSEGEGRWADGWARYSSIDDLIRRAKVRK
ncbi:hypothetical protein HWV62_36025 [Athelia sp. TMB]|nr:hypothetical protein HWV62_36025 [Athelia sp. TMB]